MNKHNKIKAILAISVFLIAAYLLVLEFTSKGKAVVFTSVDTPAAPATPLLNTKEKSKHKPKIAPQKKATFLETNKSAMLISKVYAAELNFPPYSQPLTNNDFDRLNPNYFNPQTMMVDDDGGKISASLSKYRYTYPEPIIVHLSEGGANEDKSNTTSMIDSAVVDLIDPSTKKVIMSQSFQWHDGHWQSTLAGEKDLPYELEAKVTTHVNGHVIPIVLALKYVDPVATITAFDPARTDGADMIITARITTKKSGLYRVRANLFDANNQPIAHLVTKKKLKKGSKSIELKAHQLVLQNRQAPFYLSTIMVELMSPAPGVRKEFGDSLINKFIIDDFAISSLDASPYEMSKQEKQRLMLLQQIANTGS